MAKPRKSYYWWIAGKILYGLLGLGIFVMVLFLLWRVLFSGGTPKEFEHLAPNDALVELYEAKGEDMVLRTQEHEIFTRDEDNNGYFAAPRLVYIPEANQMQVLLRYNNSTLEATKHDFGLDHEPPRGELVFDVSLLKIKDLTPDDLSDNKDGSDTLGEERVAPTSHIIETTKLYTFILYTFEGVVLTDDIIVMYLDIYYGGAVDYGSDAYGTIRMYHKDAPWIDLELTKNDKAALSAYRKQGE